MKLTKFETLIRVIMVFSFWSNKFNNVPPEKFSGKEISNPNILPSRLIHSHASPNSLISYINGNYSVFGDSKYIPHPIDRLEIAKATEQNEQTSHSHVLTQRMHDFLALYAEEQTLTIEHEGEILEILDQISTPEKIQEEIFQLVKSERAKKTNESSETKESSGMFYILDVVEILTILAGQNQEYQEEIIHTRKEKRIPHPAISIILDLCRGNSINNSWKKQQLSLSCDLVTRLLSQIHLESQTGIPTDTSINSPYNSSRQLLESMINKGYQMNNNRGSFSDFDLIAIEGISLLVESLEGEIDLETLNNWYIMLLLTNPKIVSIIVHSLCPEKIPVDTNTPNLYFQSLDLSAKEDVLFAISHLARFYIMVYYNTLPIAEREIPTEQISETINYETLERFIQTQDFQIDLLKLESKLPSMLHLREFVKHQVKQTGLQDIYIFPDGSLIINENPELRGASFVIVVFKNGSSKLLIPQVDSERNEYDFTQVIQELNRLYQQYPNSIATTLLNFEHHSNDRYRINNSSSQINTVLPQIIQTISASKVSSQRVKVAAVLEPIKSWDTDVTMTLWTLEHLGEVNEIQTNSASPSSGLETLENNFDILSQLVNKFDTYSGCPPPDDPIWRGGNELDFYSNQPDITILPRPDNTQVNDIVAYNITIGILLYRTLNPATIEHMLGKKRLPNDFSLPQVLTSIAVDKNSVKHYCQVGVTEWLDFVCSSQFNGDPCEMVNSVIDSRGDLIPANCRVGKFQIGINLIDYRNMGADTNLVYMLDQLRSGEQNKFFPSPTPMITFRGCEEESLINPTTLSVWITNSHGLSSNASKGNPELFFEKEIWQVLVATVTKNVLERLLSFIRGMNPTYTFLPRQAQVSGTRSVGSIATMGEVVDYVRIITESTSELLTKIFDLSELSLENISVQNFKIDNNQILNAQITLENLRKLTYNAMFDSHKALLWNLAISIISSEVLMLCLPNILNSTVTSNWGRVRELNRILKKLKTKA